MRLLTDDSLCLVIDVQEKLMPVMHHHESALARIHRLIDGLKVLGVPFIVSEQYPKGLGPTVASVRERIDSPALAKVSFSCCDDPALLESLLGSGRKNILVCGVEAHVCVQQTVTDLATLGFQAVVVADAVASRDPADVGRALERMRSEGALITGSESLLFELTRTAGTDVFKSISKLVK